MKAANKGFDVIITAGGEKGPYMRWYASTVVSQTWYKVEEVKKML